MIVANNQSGSSFGGAGMDSTSAVRATGTSTPITSSVPRITLRDEEREALARALEAIEADFQRDPEAFLIAARAAAGAAPMRVQQALAAVANDPAAHGVLLLRNLPQERELPATPLDGALPEGRALRVALGAHLGLAQMVAQPFGYVHERRGTIVHAIAPVPGHERSGTSKSSETLLNMHSEISWNAQRPSHLVLSCLRADHAGEALTLLASAREALARLDASHVALLRQPLFRIPAPESFRVGHGGAVLYSDPSPLVSGPEDLPELRMNRFIVGVSPEAIAAHAELAAALEHPDVVEAVRLRPGQMLVIDNRKYVHGRTRFTPRLDGTDRWLFRSYLRPSGWDARRFPGAASRTV